MTKKWPCRVCGKTPKIKWDEYANMWNLDHYCSRRADVFLYTNSLSVAIREWNKRQEEKPAAEERK